jgi:D-alanyl-D-alanine carboxypeptidase
MNTQIRMKNNVRSGNRKKRRKRRLFGLLICILLAVSLLFIGQALLFKPAHAGYLSAASGSPQSTDPPQNDTQSPSSSVMGIATVVPEDTAQGSHAADGDWRLLLVSPKNSLPEDFTVKLTKLANDHAVDERCYPDLQQMMDDCRAEGLHPVICSSYRTNKKQQQLFDNKVKKLVAQGYSQKAAYEKAATVIAVPGTSEHQTGLALDIVDVNNQNLDESQANTPVQLWLMKNSWRYGFILRYPADKTEITGITHEPWHYRYIGKEAAKEIYDKGICLEEYLGQ